MKNIQLIKKNFVKQNNLETSPDLEDSFYYPDSISGSSPANMAGSILDASLGVLTPTIESTSARMIQKEEMWKSAVKNQGNKNGKRLLTPEKEGRKTKLKGGKQH